MFFTATGFVVPGITAKLVLIPVTKSVNTKAKMSLEIHWNSPYSLDANKKSKLNELNAGLKSNSKKATSLIGVVNPLETLLRFCKKLSELVFNGELKLFPV